MISTNYSLSDFPDIIKVSDEVRLSHINPDMKTQAFEEAAEFFDISPNRMQKHIESGLLHIYSIKNKIDKIGYVALERFESEEALL